MKCYASKLKLFGYLASFGVVGGIGYVQTTAPDLPNQLFGWLLVAFCGLGFILFSLQLLTWGPVIIINEEGIEDRRLRIGPFCWEDILSVETFNVDRSVGFLLIKLKAPEKYLSRVRWWKLNTRRTFDPVEIKCFGITPHLDVVMRYIRFRQQDHAWIRLEKLQQKSNENSHFSELDH